MAMTIAVAVVAAAPGQQDSRRSFTFCGAKGVVRLGARVGVLWLLYARLWEPHPTAPRQRHGHKQASNMADAWSGKGKVAKGNADWL